MATDEDRYAVDRALLAKLVERSQQTDECSPCVVAYLARRRVQVGEIEKLLASLEAVGVPCGPELRRKLLVLTLAQEPPALTLVLAILETEHGDPPTPHYVLHLLGELDGADDHANGEHER